jgi:hypothetical protein
MNAINLPSPETIWQQIEARRTEIAELRKLLRMSEAAAKAQEARARQRPVEQLRGGVHVA